jgi:ERI1 exoribonuclease 3
MFLKLKDLPKLHPETTKITGITQAQVDAGLLFPDALQAYQSWLETHGVLSSKFAFATCGDWDLGKMLPLQCANHGVARPAYFEKWINIKDVFDTFYNKKKNPVSGMAAMLKSLGMQLEGHHHSGIDDCRNLARIVSRMIAEGCQFNTTASDDNNPMKQRKKRRG